MIKLVIYVIRHSRLEKFRTKFLAPVINSANMVCYLYRAKKKNVGFRFLLIKT